MSQKSTGSYPPDWPAIAKAAKDAAGWRCIRCDHPHDPAAGYTLTVHHLTLDKSNCRWWNLAALCQRCHLHIQANVVMNRIWYLPHSPWMAPLAAGYYAYMLGLPDDRETVLANMQQLIEAGQGYPLAPKGTRP